MSDGVAEKGWRVATDDAHTTSLEAYMEAIYSWVLPETAPNHGGPLCESTGFIDMVFGLVGCSLPAGHGGPQHEMRCEATGELLGAWPANVRDAERREGSPRTAA